jgi:hypothetical protein
MKLVIVTKEHDKLGLGKLDQPIGVRSPADVVVERSIHEPRIAKGGYDAGGVVVRRVVGHHQGEMAIALPEDTCDRPAKELRSIPGGNADRNVDAISIIRRVRVCGQRT